MTGLLKHCSLIDVFASPSLRMESKVSSYCSNHATALLGLASMVFCESGWVAFMSLSRACKDVLSPMFFMEVLKSLISESSTLLSLFIMSCTRLAYALDITL